MEVINQLLTYGNYRGEVSGYEVKLNIITRDSTGSEWFNLMVNAEKSNLSIRWYYPKSTPMTVISYKVKQIEDFCELGSIDEIFKLMGVMS